MRGDLGLILDRLHPASRFDDDVLRIRDPEPARWSCSRPYGPVQDRLRRHARPRRDRRGDRRRGHAAAHPPLRAPGAPAARTLSTTAVPLGALAGGAVAGAFGLRATRPVTRLTAVKVTRLAAVKQCPRRIRRYFST
jgi:hypothetical protein